MKIRRNLSPILDVFQEKYMVLIGIYRVDCSKEETPPEIFCLLSMLSQLRFFPLEVVKTKFQRSPTERHNEGPQTFIIFE